MVTDGMLTAAAETVAGLVDATTPGAPLLPQVDDLRAVSSAVGAAAARAAEADGVARVTEADWAAAVTRAMWKPDYRPVVPEGGRG
jgi:malate dehydrogenase (oxaloacetate-decarboxylating)